jgi:hypothetical protein
MLATAPSALGGDLNASDVAEWVDALRFPIIVFLIVGAIVWLWKSGLLEGLLSRATSVSALGLELKFSAGAAQHNRKVVEQSMAELREELQREVDHRVDTHEIERKLQSVIDNVSMSHPIGRLSSLRATVHIPDPLLKRALYQAIDYVPAGAGRGRSFSVRFGLIGSPWRADGE